MLEGWSNRFIMAVLLCMLVLVPLAATAQDASPTATGTPAGNTVLKIDSGDTA
jgi:hypothetical protein